MKPTLLLLIIICNECSGTVGLLESFQTGYGSQNLAKLSPRKHVWPRGKHLLIKTDKDSRFLSIISKKEDGRETLLKNMKARNTEHDFVASPETSLRIRRKINPPTLAEDLAEPELERSPETNPEPGPEWSTAFQAWGKAWDLHIYLFAVLYILIAVTSGVGLADDLLTNHGIKGLKLTLYLTFLFLGCSRGIMLLVDPYNSQRVLDTTSSYITWSLGFPCVLTALGLLLLVFIEATSMEIAPPRFQKLSTALGIMVLNVIITLGTDVVFLLSQKIIALVIICHVYFVFFGGILTAGYFYVGYKLSCNSAASIYGDTGLQRLRILVFTTAVLNVLFIGIQLYSAFDFVLRSDVPGAWSWYAVQTSLRALEVSMCGVMLLIAFNNRVRSSRSQVRASINQLEHTVSPFPAWGPSDGQNN